MNDFPLATELPDRAELKEKITKLFKTLGAEQLTMKILRIRLNADYKLDFKPFTKELSGIVNEIMQGNEVSDTLAAAAAKADSMFGGPRLFSATPPPTSSTALPPAVAHSSSPSALPAPREGEPRRASSAYFLWQNAKRDEVRAQLEAEADEGKKVGLGDVGKKLGALWKEVGDFEKAPWEARAAQDSLRYEREYAAYHSQPFVSSGKGALFTAVVAQDIEAARRALSEVPRCANETGRHPISPHGDPVDDVPALYVAALRRDRAMVDLLLSTSSGAPREAATPFATEPLTRSTALFPAVIHDDVHIVRALVEHGAMVFHTDADGWNVVHVCSYFGSVRVLPFLLRDHAVDHPDGNAALADGWRPLHIAAYRRHVGVVDLLLGDGKASKTARTNNGETALDIAVRMGHDDVARRLQFDF